MTPLPLSLDVGERRLHEIKDRMTLYLSLSLLKEVPPHIVRDGGVETEALSAHIMGSIVLLIDGRQRNVQYRSLVDSHLALANEVVTAHIKDDTTHVELAHDWLQLKLVEHVGVWHLASDLVLEEDVIPLTSLGQLDEV